MNNRKNNVFKFSGNRTEYIQMLKSNPGIIFCKFTATWCGPCKKLKPIIDKCFSMMPENIHCYEIDIDENFDVFGLLKRKKMIQGVPSIFCYIQDNEEVYPDEFMSGGTDEEVIDFFDRCVKLLQ